MSDLNTIKYRIGFDARCMSTPGGVANYTRILINEISRICPADWQLIVFYNDKKLLGTFKQPNVREVAFNFNAKPLFVIWDQLVIAYFSFRYKIDVLHGTKNTIPALTFSKRVTTVLDLIPVLYPKSMKPIESLYWKLVFWLDAKLKATLIFISESTQADYFRLYSTNNKSQVVHLAVEDRELVSGQPDKQIILFNGAQEPRKNLPNLIRAFAKLNAAAPATKLYLVGKPGWEDPEINVTIAQLGLQDKVVRPGFVSSALLDEIYANTFAYAYVSQYEGFGLPILEAMARSVPVVTSNTSSMPEVAGDAALLVDPYNVEEIADALLKLYNQPELRQKLITRGHINLKNFSWNKCAQETLSIYKSLLPNVD